MRMKSEFNYRCWFTISVGPSHPSELHGKLEEFDCDGTDGSKIGRNPISWLS